MSIVFFLYIRFFDRSQTKHLEFKIEITNPTKQHLRVVYYLSFSNIFVNHDDDDDAVV